MGGWFSWIWTLQSGFLVWRKAWRWLQCVTCVEGDFIDTLGSGLPSEGEEVEDDCDVGSVVREISLIHWGEAAYTRGKKAKYGYFLWSVVRFHWDIGARFITYNGEKSLKMVTLRERSLFGGVLLVCVGQFQSSKNYLLQAAHVVAPMRRIDLSPLCWPESMDRLR